jgi:hypothetical protein
MSPDQIDNFIYFFLKTVHKFYLFTSRIGESWVFFYLIVAWSIAGSNTTCLIVIFTITDFNITGFHIVVFIFLSKKVVCISSNTTR